eukprot:TRINITY_DN85813_c0_g2_i1.p1 TRINITY_DN85813_c0_g2~~TRINITY_DN85813_c0_g2_i1.p1  ORF type:complete len:653 (-),score=149.86 TRINITY_DN85813_c0_g2_i1:266-2224(-)
MYLFKLVYLFFVVSTAFAAVNFDWSDIKTSKQLSAVDGRQFVSFTAEYLKTFSDLKICDGFTASQTHYIEPKILKTISPSCFQMLGTSCSGFGSTQVMSIPLDAWSNLSSECAQNFNTIESYYNSAGCSGFGTRNTQGSIFNKINPKMIQYFSDTCVGYFGMFIFSKASAEQMRMFSKSQCAHFEKSFLQFMNKDAWKGITQICASGLNTESKYKEASKPCAAINQNTWTYLENATINGLNEACISQMDVDVFKKASPDSITALSTTSCKGLTRKELINMNHSAVTSLQADCFMNTHDYIWGDYCDIIPYFNDEVCQDMPVNFIKQFTKVIANADLFTERCISLWPNATFKELTTKAIEYTTHFGGYCGHLDVVFDETLAKITNDTVKVSFDDYFKTLGDKISQVAFPKCYSTLFSKSFDSYKRASSHLLFPRLLTHVLAFTASNDFKNLNNISDIPQARLMGIRAAQAVYIKGDALESLKVEDLLHLQFEFFAGIGPYQISHLSNGVVAELFKLEQKTVKDESIFPILYLPASSIPILKQSQLNAALGTINPVKNMCKEQLKALTMIQLSWLTTDVRNEIKTRINTAQACPENDFKFEKPKNDDEHPPKSNTWKFIVGGFIAVVCVVVVFLFVSRKNGKSGQESEAYRSME